MRSPDVTPSPKRIEMIGPSGVGKTTLLAALRQRRPRGAAWKTIDEELATIATDLAGKEKSLRGYGYSLLARLPRIGPLLARRFLFGWRTNLAVMARHEPWEPFLEICTQLVARGDDPAFVRLYKSMALVQTLRELAAIEVHGRSSLVLCDESVVSVGLYSLFGYAGDQAGAFFESLPKPAGVVCLRTTPELVYQRLLRRRQAGGHLPLMFYGLEEDELMRRVTESVQRADHVINLIHESGLPAVDVQAAAPLDQQVAAIETLMHQVSSPNASATALPPEAAPQGGGS